MPWRTEGDAQGVEGWSFVLAYNSADFWKKFNILSFSPSTLLAELTWEAGPKEANKIACTVKLEESIIMNI